MGTFDVVLIDLQDVGCRIYTFITTLLYVLEAAAANGKQVWVLDPPNPAGRTRNGTVGNGGGLTVDERLLSGLDAAEEALTDLARRMTQDDRAALETQGRFIESRYKAQDTDTPSP